MNMHETSFAGRAACACVFLCLAALQGTASPPGPPAPVPPLTPVFEETLTSLRAPMRVEKLDNQLVETPRGLLPMSDGLSSRRLAMHALIEAFRVPLCREFAYPQQPLTGESANPRFPFAVEANERLVDALDKLEKNSGGFLQWGLLDNRIVVITHDPGNKGETSIMDRPVRVEVQAGTLLQALEQVEAAYNKEYKDGPLIVRPQYLRVDLRGPVTSRQPGEFVLKTEDRLRAIVLALVDQLGDPAICYNIFGSFDLKGRPYFALLLEKDDAPEYSEYADGDEASEHFRLLKNSSERLESYFTAME